MPFDCTTCSRQFYTGISCEREDCPKAPMLANCEEPDRWTVPEDPENEPRPGWGPFKLDKIWWFPKLDGYVKWHDRVTKFCSVAQRIGVTVKQINESQRSQLKDKGFAGYVVDNVIRPIQRFFYEGKLK